MNPKRVRETKVSFFFFVYSSATGDLDNIRRAYSSFSAVYPLTAELWLKYIDVELVLAQSPKEIEQVKQLFQRALQDYYCEYKYLSY